MRFTYTEANLLPRDHPENVQYDAFVETFGEEGNLIVIAVKDSNFFNPATFNKWIALNDKIEKLRPVGIYLSFQLLLFQKTANLNLFVELQAYSNFLSKIVQNLTEQDATKN